MKFLYDGADVILVNMEQFNLVKELILDLLGWGVSPEYLVDCGLTREAVFYAFSELNLRLPSNLDVSGLCPFPSFPSAQSRGISSHSQNWTSSDTPPLVPKLDRPAAPAEVARRPSVSHTLPPKPIAAPVSPTSSTFPSSNGATSGPNLSDMEAQRRQELLARKAVLASRRKKPVSSTAISKSFDPSAMNDQPDAPNEEPMRLVSSDTVDSFLNSMLGSASTLPAASATHSPEIPAVAHRAADLTRSPSTSLIDFDQVDPSSSMTHAYGVPESGMELPGVPNERVVVDFSSQRPVIDRRGSGSSGNTPLQSSFSTTPASSRRSTTPNTTASYITANAKRGTKRPVAMDFVDEGPMSSGPVALHHSRRKPTSFAGLSQNIARKCVIEFSDSEDDGDEGTSFKFQDANPSITVREPIANRSETPTIRPPSARIPNSATTPAASPKTPEIAPSSLLEKEEQIKRMREMIQNRERERLRRLAEVRLCFFFTFSQNRHKLFHLDATTRVFVQKTRTPTATPPLSAAVSLSAPQTTQSLVTGPILPSVVNHLNHVPPSAVPLCEPVESNSTSDDQAEEDIVMQNLTNNSVYSFLFVGVLTEIPIRFRRRTS